MESGHLICSFVLLCVPWSTHKLLIEVQGVLISCSVQGVLPYTVVKERTAFVSNHYVVDTKIHEKQ